ncbi:uncharacterized protein LOC124885207 [Capsicum annuum]|uniref:uncharacterized protein LOC124885207 n=1 Tax=Capsicum annuum TaxID=4072 RepID=UPI001FB0B60D|nr:uncharacterized protein LOC124885207 [Capsicum annuum]
MDITLRYVNKKGKVNERVIAIVRVGDTLIKTLKETICVVLMRNSLSTSKICGQGYDGASNMQGEMNGLKALICKKLYRHIASIILMMNEMIASLQIKEQDIVNAMIFLDINKTRLQLLRDDGWNALMSEVYVFRDKYDILVPKMDDFYLPGKSKRRPSSVTYSHHLRVELFYAIIDLQLQELSNHFDVVSGNLLIGKIMILAKHYPVEFGESKLRELSYQLNTFIIHMRHGDPIYSNLKGIGDLAEALVNGNLVETYSLVYLVVKLTLILPVATVTVERAFSSMKHIKNELHSSIGDAFLSDCLVCYIEKDIFVNISNDAIIDRLQNMKMCRCLV